MTCDTQLACARQFRCDIKALWAESVKQYEHFLRSASHHPGRRSSARKPESPELLPFLVWSTRAAARVLRPAGSTFPSLAVTIVSWRRNPTERPNGPVKITIHTIPQTGIMQDTRITVAHSPDSDDAFMFYGLARELIPAHGFHFEHILQDIQTLNERATRGELDISAVSIHAYSHLLDKYALLPSGCSMGDKYGPIVVAPQGHGPTMVKGSRLVRRASSAGAWKSCTEPSTVPHWKEKPSAAGSS